MIVANVCLICWEAFKLMGLGLLHGTVTKYLASPTLKANPEEHRKFIKASKVYIKKKNEEPGMDDKSLQKCLCVKERAL